MKIATRTAAAALLISLPMALGACGSDGGSKPSKADVKAGFIKAMKGEPQTKSVPDAMMKKYSGCVVDKIYPKASNKTLNAVKSGDTDSKMDSDDESMFKSAVQDCGSSLAGN